jgi:3-oxoacyl-[acyl-carrier protein] reductase
MQERAKGKVALVTGGSRGIGAEIARRLAREGADVAVTYHRGKVEAEEVAEEVRALGRRAVAIETELADAESAEQIVASVVEQLGRLDILVNNAGVTTWGALGNISVEEFDGAVAVNARAPFLVLQAASRVLFDGGRVINISSGVTSSAQPGSALYAATKAFVDQVTKVAAVELASRRITVNAVAPGTTTTGRLANLTDEERTVAGASFGLGRIGEPADTAGLVAFLASDDAAFITGQVIYNTGAQRGRVA